MIQPPDESLSPIPWTRWPKFSAASLRADLQAGFTVAVFAVPQAMAYAVLAGVAPVYGLYLAVSMSLVAALFGSSPFINAGPTVTASLLTASAIAPFAVASSPEEVARVLWTFTLLVGVLRLALGLLKAGPLVRLVPEHAMLGFVTAADLLIAVGQLSEFLGTRAPSGSTLQKLVQVGANLPSFDWRPLLIGSVTVAILWGFERFSKKFPVALGAVVVATGIGLALNTLFAASSSVRLVVDIAPIPRGLPTPVFYLPDLELIGRLLPAALTVAAIGLIEAVSISSTLALKKKQRVNFNQEFLGQGLSQIVGGIFQGFPGSSSYSRSALIERNGGVTPLANVIFAFGTALALLLFPGWLERIPLAALAGLLLYTGLKLVDVPALQRVWKASRADFGVVALTFVVTFFGRLELGFLLGVVTALALFVMRARDLQLFELLPRPDGKWDELAYTIGSRHERSDVVALALHGDLFFGLAHELREQLAEIVRLQNPKWIVVRMRRAHSVDASVWGAFAEFARTFGATGGQVVLAGLSADQAKLVARTDLGAAICAQNLISREGAAFEAFETGLARVAGELSEDAVLSPPWREKMSRVKARDSVSHYRDPFNDPATLGAIEV